MTQLFQIKAAIKGDVPVLLEGHTGTGKTYLIMELAKSQNKTLHVINVSGELTVDSILGQQTLIDGTIHWRDGVLTQAMRKGDWVLFDELNTALPEVLTVINGVLDDSRSVTLPNADNERVRAHDDFRFIGTQNPASGDYSGAARLNNALLNRMVKFTVDYMEFASEVEALKQHTSLRDSTLVQLVKLAQYTRNRFDEHLSTRDLVKILRLKEGGLTLKDAVTTVVASRFNEEEYRQLRDYNEAVLRDLRDMNDGDSSLDPFERLKQQAAELKKQQAELDKQKQQLRDTVRRDILKDVLLMGSTDKTTVPEDF